MDTNSNNLLLTEAPPYDTKTSTQLILMLISGFWGVLIINAGPYGAFYAAFLKEKTLGRILHARPLLELLIVTILYCFGLCCLFTTKKLADELWQKFRENKKLQKRVTTSQVTYSSHLGGFNNWHKRIDALKANLRSRRTRKVVRLFYMLLVCGSIDLFALYKMPYGALLDEIISKGFFWLLAHRTMDACLVYSFCIVGWFSLYLTKKISDEIWDVLNLKYRLLEPKD